MVAALVGGSVAAITSAVLPSIGIVAGALAGVAAALWASNKNDHDQEKAK